MAKISLEFPVKYWARHHCSYCQAIFRYRVERKVSVTASTEAEARETTTEELRDALDPDVEYHPCPTCNLIQPAMVGSGRSVRHVALLLANLPLFFVLLAGLMQWLPPEMMGWIIAGWLLLLLIGHLLSANWDPNRSVAANRKLVTQELADGTVELETAGHAPPYLDETGATVAAGRAWQPALWLAGGIILARSADLYQAATQAPALPFQWWLIGGMGALVCSLTASVWYVLIAFDLNTSDPAHIEVDALVPTDIVEPDSSDIR